MARRAYLLAGAAAAAIVTALVAASVETAPILGSQSHRVLVSTTPQGPAHPRAVESSGGGFPAWLTIGVTALLTMYALALFVLVALSVRGRSEPADDAADADEDASPDGAWGVVLPVELRDAVQNALTRLHEGSPRNAIVACWVCLRTATFRSGLPERPSDTAQEFVVRAVHGLGLDPSAVQTLAALYREARFSDHPMNEAQRDRAGLALRTLVDQLDQRGTAVEPRQLLEGSPR